MTFAVKVIKGLLNVIYLFFKLFKRRNQITLISRESNDITVDFALLEKELKNELKDYKIVVLCKKMDNKFLYAFHMLKQMYHISRSKVVILDTYCILISVLHHKKGLKVIQIWHALGLMKKAGYSILGKSEGRGIKESQLMNMHKNYDYIYTSSNECIDAFSKVFNYDKKYIKSVPLPRIDLLKDKKYQKENKKKIIDYYPLLNNGKKNILYAPTLRKDESKMEGAINDLVNSIDYKKYNLIIKLHPLSKINISYDGVIVDNYFSTMEMYSISDYVISDYSSIIYEAGIMNKSLIFYAFDLDKYKDSRDFFIDYNKEVPGPIVKNKKELKSFLDNPDYSKYKNRNMISKYVDLTIDNYSKNMANEIKKVLYENEKN